VVPVENVFKFCQRHKIQLHVVEGDHRLIRALPLLEKLFGLFLDELLEQT
jgi:hypothetical protein